MLLRLIACFSLLSLQVVPNAVAAKRVALLIGNQDYVAEVGRLKNPINDVNLVAASLRKIGFANVDIEIVRNGTRREILQAVDKYSSKLKAAGQKAIGFFYYSGHGLARASNQKNYLIPVNVKRIDANVWYDAIRLDDVVTTLQETASNAAHFVIFDACRNILNTKTKGSKGFSPILTRRGMLIAFATDPGRTASDEGNGSGPYASALAAELVRPGLDHLDLFQNVKEVVWRKTRSQTPWERNGLLQRVYLAGPAKRREQIQSIVKIRRNFRTRIVSTVARDFEGAFDKEPLHAKHIKVIASADANSDELDDFIIDIRHPSLCGSGGCQWAIYAGNLDGKYNMLLSMRGYWSPKFLKTKTNGLLDVTATAFETETGRIFANLAWNVKGKKYKIRRYAYCSKAYLRENCTPILIRPTKPKWVGPSSKSVLMYAGPDDAADTSGASQFDGGEQIGVTLDGNWLLISEHHLIAGFVKSKQTSQ